VLRSKPEKAKSSETPRSTVDTVPIDIRCATRLGTLNVRIMLEFGSAELLTQELKKMSFSFMGLQEVR